MLGVATLLLLQVQMGAVVRPETVTVGEHFTVTVRLRVPAGAQIRFPTSPDTAASVDTVTALQRSDGSGAQFVETTVRYVLAAWDTGTQNLGLGDVVVVLPSGERLASLRDLSIYVRSVLPADSALRTPKPPRPQVGVSIFNWVPWAIGAAIAALLLLLAWLWRRRRPEGAVRSPLEWAEGEFARASQSGWLDGGEPERYAIRMADISRGYLARAVPALPISLTTRELAVMLLASPELPRDRMVGLLETVDPIKFARRDVTREQAAELGGSARALVIEADSALRAAEAAARDAAREAARAREPQRSAA